MIETAEALQSLLDSPGWEAFRAHIQGEWGAGGTRFETTLNTCADSRQDDVYVLQQIRQIAVARREILRLLTWPKEEIERLRAPEESCASPRRAMSAALLGQSRRGGL